MLVCSGRYCHGTTVTRHYFNRLILVFTFSLLNSVWMPCEQCRVWRVWTRPTTLLVSCCSYRASVRSGSFTFPNSSETYRQVHRKAPINSSSSGVIIHHSVIQCFSFNLICAGKPVLFVPDLHISAAQQKDAPSLPSGQKSGSCVPS